MCQVLIDRLPLPFAECVDITNGEHDFERNVYEEMYPETLYSLEVVQPTACDIDIDNDDDDDDDDDDE